MEQVDLGREAGEVGRLLEGRVSAADHGDLAVLEEEPVAGRAGRYAAAAQAGLARQVQPHGRRTGRHDDRLRAIFRATRPDPERSLREVDAIDVDIHQARPEALSLCPHGGHQRRPLDAVREARVVLHVAGQHQLPARLRTRQDDRLQVGPGRIDRGGQTRRPRTDDDDLRVHPALAAGDGGGAAGGGHGGRLGRRVDHGDGEPAERVGTVGHVVIVPRSLILPGGITGGRAGPAGRRAPGARSGRGH